MNSCSLSIGTAYVADTPPFEYMHISNLTRNSAEPPFWSSSAIALRRRRLRAARHYARQYPVDPVVRELLHPRFQSIFMKVEVVHRADAKYGLPGISTTDSVHEGSTCLTEVISHHVSWGDCLRLGECGQVVFSANVTDVLVVNDEIESKH